MMFTHEKFCRNAVITLNNGADSKLVFIDWYGSHPKIDSVYFFPKQNLQKASFNYKDDL